MDIGKRSAEVATVVATAIVVAEFGDKHGWWQVAYFHSFLEYAFPISILVALGMNLWVLNHRRENLSRDLAPQNPETQMAPPSTATGQRRPAVPIIGITLRDAVVEPYDQTPGRYYPRKLRLYCSNDGDDIELGIGTWIPDQIGLQVGRRPACQYELKDHLGRFSGESSTKFIPSGQSFRLYVGLDSSASDKELARMRTEHALGILEIAAMIAGVAVKVRIRP